MINPTCIRRPPSPQPRTFVPPDGEPYSVQDGDSWESVAAAVGMTAWELIRFNYPRLPANEQAAAREVNWYLQEYVGCKQLTDDNKNYCFSAAADPGVIYVPRARAGGAVSYRVPGIIFPLKQPSPMACWATMFAMMLSWQRHQSVPIRTAVAELGPVFLKTYDADKGLAIKDHRTFAMFAGLEAEPLENLTPEGWADLLRQHGLLWTCYGWKQFDAKGKELRSGRHAIVLYGIQGDGTTSGTNIDYIDPGDGQKHRMSFGQFLGQHETGYAGWGPLSPQEELGFSQILHY